ncbi:MAG: hypothetical protein H6571_07265 [Lewinellaceae bacterium]|nr:hypothetical protein [Lewinellaceae bacterium]
MKIKSHFLEFLLVCVVIIFIGIPTIDAQSNAKEDLSYDRSSFVILKIANKQGTKLNFRSFYNSNNPYAKRFDWNNISTKELPKSILSGKPANNVTTQAMTNSHIGRELLEYWFQRSQEGEFNTKLIADRGMYNASDLEKQLAKSGPRDIAELKDAGFNLINKSYIILVDVKAFLTMEEYYNVEDQIRREIARDNPGYKFVPIERTQRGYAGNFIAHVFKLDYNEQVQQTLYDNWIYEDDSEETRAHKIAAFENLNVPVVFVDKQAPDKYIFASESKNVTKSNSAVKPRTDEEFIKIFEEEVIEKVLDQLTVTNEDFQVKTGLYKANPILAKIGVKEGVYPEKRFFVLEKKEKADGKIVYKRKGIVRAKSGVTNNTRTSSQGTKPSEFIRVGGLAKLEEGMLLKEKPEKGIAVACLFSPPGISTSEIRDIGANLEYNLSLTLGRKWGSEVRNGLRTGVGFTLESIKVEGNFDEDKYKEFQHIWLYLKKEYPVASIFRAGIFVGIANDWALNEATNEKHTALLLPLGAEGGVKLSYWMEAFLSLEYDVPVTKAYMDIGGKMEETELKWFDIYPHRAGITNRVGVRIAF